MRKKIGKIVLFLILFISINLIFSRFQDTKAATTIYVPLNGTYTLTETTNQYSVGDSSIASVSVGNQYSYTIACLGTDSNYDGEEVDFADYDFDLEAIDLLTSSRLYDYIQYSHGGEAEITFD